MSDPEAPRLWEQAVEGEGPEPLREDEFRYLVSFAKRVLWSPPEVRQRLQAAGVNIVPANFYSEVPLVEDIESSFEYREEEQPPYADLFDEAHMRLVAERLLPHAEAFDPPVHGDLERPEGYFWANPAFSNLDALAYWSVLREVEPDLVVEIGSGYSTLVADEALRANGHGEIVSIEPYPKAFLHDVPSVTRIDERRVQDIPLPELLDLVESAEVLFIDSTHTVKLGSDCLRIYLQLLPRLQEPVIAHTHDVALPWGMPRENALQKHAYWTEQYLLQALLLRDPAATMLFGSMHCNRTYPDLAERMTAGRVAQRRGGSVWYGLNGASLPGLSAT